MTTEQKFHAAVNVIRSLPKNGSYQPSHDLMLRFYAYYKQAMEGPCTQAKPAFWEVIRKAKWDAWTKLGNMGRNEAMSNYVEELKKIVETMAYTDNVADFLGSLDAFYETVPNEDLELLVGPVLERMRSRPGSPLSGSPIGSRETSPHRVRGTSRHITSSLETSPASSHSASPLPPDTDGEEEEFIDTVESAPERSNKENNKSSISLQQTPAGNAHSKQNGQVVIPKENPSELMTGHSTMNGRAHVMQETIHETMQDRGRSRDRKDDKKNAEFLAQISATVQNLQRDLDGVTARMRTLEGQALSALTPRTAHTAERRFSKRWPLSECSPQMLALIVLWPFVAHAIINLARRTQQRKL